MIPHTSLLDMHPIPRNSLNNESYEAMYSFSHFNPLQSQMFHVLYHTDNNILVGAPTGNRASLISFSQKKTCISILNIVILFFQNFETATFSK